ncbi:MAG: hypothetical protein IT372_08110 [Polyangiaceae bacterium]|nr:hypothetical protein [Polyangiaceae bacterium]
MEWILFAWQAATVLGGFGVMVTSHFAANMLLEWGKNSEDPAEMCKSGRAAVWARLVGMAGLFCMIAVQYIAAAIRAAK